MIRNKKSTECRVERGMFETPLLQSTYSMETILIFYEFDILPSLYLN